MRSRLGMPRSEAGGPSFTPRSTHPLYPRHGTRDARVTRSSFIRSLLYNHLDHGSQPFSCAIEVGGVDCRPHILTLAVVESGRLTIVDSLW